jgi:hypothetical protein
VEDLHDDSIYTHPRSNIEAGKILDNLIDIRLFREENQAWVEKAVVTRIWIATTNMSSDNTLEQLQELLDIVSQNSKSPLTASATHAAQTVNGSHVRSRRQVLIHIAATLEASRISCSTRKTW